MQRLKITTGIAITVACCCALTAFLFANINRSQWDFSAYYHAVKAKSQGANPYDQGTLSRYAGCQMNGGYVYPPYTLSFFHLFSLVGFNAGAILFLAFKCLLVVLLVIIWSRYFLDGRIDMWFVLLLAMGFNSAVFMDLKTGNISLIEQILLWSAFVFFVKGRLFYFCICIIAAASFKLIPIVFLVLLLFDDHPKKYWYFGCAATLFGLILGVSYLADPTLFRMFLANATDVYLEYGVNNPSTMTLIRDCSRFILQKSGMALPTLLQWTIYLLFIVTVTGISIKRITAIKTASVQFKKITLIFMACMVYALIHPRFKDYSYILLLAPAYHIVRNTKSISRSSALILLMLIPAQSPLPGFQMLFEYYSLFVAFTVWWIYQQDLKSRLL